jgi:hypothetical protein
MLSNVVTTSKLGEVQDFSDDIVRYDPLAALGMRNLLLGTFVLCFRKVLAVGHRDKFALRSRTITLCAEVILHRLVEVSSGATLQQQVADAVHFG